MSKIEELTTTTNTFLSIQQLNSNFQKIVDAFDNTVSRDGSTPNNMESELDMDSNRIINVSNSIHSKDAVNLSQLQAIVDQLGFTEGAETSYAPYKLFLSRVVNIPTDYPTLQDAIDTESATYFAGQGVTIALNIETGHEPTTGIEVSNGDYSHFVVTCDDAELLLSSSFPTNQKFIIGHNASLPVLGCLVDANSRTSGVYEAWDNSRGFVMPNCGGKNSWGGGLYAYRGSSIAADNTIWTGCAINGSTGSGITSWASHVSAEFSDVSNSGYYGAQAAHGGILSFRSGKANDVYRHAIRATDAGIIDADQAEAHRAGTNGIYAFNNSFVNARDAKATNGNNNCSAVNGSIIHAQGADFSGATVFGLQAFSSSTIDAPGVNLDGAGQRGAYAYRGSTIGLGAASIDNVGTTTTHIAVLAEQSSTIDANGASIDSCAGDAIRAVDNSSISTNGATATLAGRYSVIAINGSRINARSVTGTGAGTEGCRAQWGSTINAQGSNFQKGGSPSSTDVVILDGSTINANGTTGGLSHTKNTVTKDGIIFQA